MINFKYKQMDIHVKDNLDVIMKLKDDNNDAITLIKNRQINERSKHIDIIYHYIRDLQKHEKINVNYIFTNEIIINDLTKPLIKQKFHKFLKLMNIKVTD